MAKIGVLLVAFSQLFELFVVMTFNFGEGHRDYPTYFFCWMWLTVLPMYLGYYMIMLLMATTVSAKDRGLSMHAVDY